MVFLTRIFIVAAVFVTIAGCELPEPSFSACAITCGAGEICPNGWSCGDDGYCHDDGSSDTCDRDLSGGADAATMPDAESAFSVDARLEPDAGVAPPSVDAAAPIIDAGVGADSATPGVDAATPPDATPPPDASPADETFCSTNVECTDPDECCVHINDYGVCVNGTEFGTLCLPT